MRFELPFEEWRDIHHCIHDKLYKPTVNDVVFLKEAIVTNEISQCTLAVRAGSDDILLLFRIKDILKCLNDLFCLHPFAYFLPPLTKIKSIHYGKPATATTAIVECSMRSHFSRRFGTNSFDNISLWLVNTPKPYNIAGIMQCGMKVVPAGVKLNSTTLYDIPEEGKATFARHL